MRWSDHFKERIEFGLGVNDDGEEPEIVKLMHDMDLAFGGFLSGGFEFGEVDIVFGHEDHSVGKAGKGWAVEFYGNTAFLFYCGDELAFEEFFVHEGLGYRG